MKTRYINILSSLSLAIVTTGFLLFSQSAVAQECDASKLSFPDLYPHPYQTCLSDTLIRVEHRDKYALFDSSGKTILPFSYGKIHPFKGGLARVERADMRGPFDFEQKSGFIDKTGKWAIPLKYYEARDFSNGLAAVQLEKNGKWGFIDTTQAKL